MPDLITLNEFKTAAGIALTNTQRDAEYTWMISAASRMISQYADRDFGEPQVTEERQFTYDGSGYLDIDDAQSISTVAMSVPGGVDVPLDITYQWVPMPPRRNDSPVYYYIALPGFIGYSGFDPEMGFTRNLDVWVNDYGRPRIPTVLKVNAIWGWPTVPDDVKQATVWTIQGWESRKGDEDLTAESIVGYSRSWGQRGQGAPPALAIPSRARDVLAQYEKIQI